MAELQTFDEVLTSLEKKRRTPHLLLGNGFSMSYDPKIFSYNALQDFVENMNDEILSKLFSIVKTKNFELVMQQLNNFSELLKVFGSDEKLLKQVEEASEKLKNSLIGAIKGLHPEHVFMIPEEESQQCASFLNQFLSRDGNVFSTNYDILLYWVLLRNRLEHAKDGFGYENEGIESDEIPDLCWGKYREDQNIHYLHGTLPIFDTGVDVIKEKYKGKGNFLLQSIQKRLDKEQYPVFVAAGNGDDKLNHIMHNRYLTYCYESLQNIEGSLVTFGFSFGDSDHHIIEAINKAAKYGTQAANKLFSIYIGVYSDEAQQHINAITPLFRCKVNMFDARTAKIWR